MNQTLQRPQANLERRAQILDFEKALSQLPGAKLGDSDLCPVSHSFAPGVYVREMRIPKGTILVSKIHKHDHPCFLLQGEISVVSESGGVQRLKAPLSMISLAGTKRIGFAHSDVIWTTVHPTKETDLAKIEEEVIAKSYDEIDSNNIEKIESDENRISNLLEAIQKEGA